MSKESQPVLDMNESPMETLPEAIQGVGKFATAASAEIAITSPSTDLPDREADWALPPERYMYQVEVS